MLDQTVKSAGVWAVGDAKHTRDSALPTGGVERAEVDEPDATGPRADLIGGGFEGQAGLASATDPGQGEETVELRQLRNVGKLVLATDEARQRRRKIVARLCRRGGATSWRRTARSSACNSSPALDRGCRKEACARRSAASASAWRWEW